MYPSQCTQAKDKLYKFKIRKFNGNSLYSIEKILTPRQKIVTLMHVDATIRFRRNGGDSAQELSSFATCQPVMRPME